MSYKHLKAKKKKEQALKRLENAAERQSRIAKKRPKPKFTPLQPRPSKYVETDGMKKFRELPSGTARVQHNVMIQSDAADCMLGMVEMDFSQIEARVHAFMGTPEGDLYKRELDARKAGTDLKSQIAPLYPKGPYQLITDENAPKYFNKKDGGL